jgi:hypothetical protein
MLYSADGLTQVRRALGIPRPHPLSRPAQALYRVAHGLEISGLQAAAREETARALSGLASALNYEKLRTDGWSLHEGWDRRAPAVSGLPVVREYHLRNAINRKIYVSEPRELTAHAIHALEALAQNGAWEVTVTATALSLPGEALAVSLRPWR